jgi:hypothetical protein
VVFVNENLIPFDQRTEEEQREIAKKGGQASVVARRKKRDMKKLIETLLDDKIKDKDGNEYTREVAMALTLVSIALDKKDKKCLEAQRLILKITGQDQSTEDKKKTKLILKQLEKDIELTQKKIDNADW